MAELEASLQPISAVQAQDSVRPLVGDAISRIAEMALPYLEELAELEMSR